ncbi:MAG: tRNA preQ1(34) S-adenosylmethionine ribosyltransferase-isomerase QueA [Synergistaceae bacterium]|jgi:S-adenosylmethionine:tRNA ribosyltransferase-isomerase|nr:tRNA preQ1(34) S-adenosylmethionine ribosyltransferase-isomerase QueA [Synergistaceae bacterium]
MIPSLYTLDAYDYELPESQIAQMPAMPRDSARLLIWSVTGDQVEHRVFRDIPDYLKDGDLLVLNDTRVLPARLWGNKNGSGGKVEILLLRPIEPNYCVWKALLRPARKLSVGSEVRVGDHVLTIEDREDEGIGLVRVGKNKEDVLAFLKTHGQTPLPPYIKYIDRTDFSRLRDAYQTVFALNDGSVAAPTASLHFTEELLKRIADRGVELAWVTLHVGLGTFRPVKIQDIREHRIHNEYCEVPQATEEAVTRCRLRHGRVVAAGTTVARTLESAATENGAIQGGVRRGAMETELFIYPGFDYKVVDAMITNFHLPKSSLLMLVAAFVNSLTGGDREMTALATLQKTYSLAINEGYRFFSFGDAMFIKK